MNSTIGIYFGPKSINIVETKGKKFIRPIQIPRSVITGDVVSDEKVPEAIKIVTLFKEEFRRNRIDVKEVAIALSGQDLIIRTFGMPAMPIKELITAVSFEAKKYIPFKIEDLVFDFQADFDKISRRNSILFVGVKKDILDKYLSIITQLNLKCRSLEYSAFSVLRFLSLAHVSNSGVVGVINTDLTGDDEVNFMVVQNGFPLFSRDITVTSDISEGSTKTQEEIASIALEKLKTELRISYDFFHRKFPSKTIRRAIFISPVQHHSYLESFSKEMGITAQFIDLSKYIPKVSFSSCFIKGYGSSLYKAIPSNLKIDLITPKTKPKPKEIKAQAQFDIGSLLGDFHVSPKSVVFGLLICLATFIYGYYRMFPLKKEISAIIATRPYLASVNMAAPYAELYGINEGYKEKRQAINVRMKEQFYLTIPINTIPQLLPEGIWLMEISFNKGYGSGDLELILKGAAYQADNDKELKLISKLLSNLKENTTFAKYFKDINISVISKVDVYKTSITSFSISCRQVPKRS